MKIEIITTPNESLKETGFGSFKSCTSVLDAICKMEHQVELTVSKTKEDLDAVVTRAPDLVILAVKYLRISDGKDLWLSEYFANQAINFSGSLREVLKYDSDKFLAKSHLRKNGVRTANFFLAIPGEFRCEGDLPFLYPLFLKPLDAANGNGIDDHSLVNNFAEFESKLASLHERFHVPVLVEEYLDGREFTVAVIKTETGDLIVSPIEIVPPQSRNGCRILGEEVKKADSEALKKAEVTDLLSRVRKLAIEAFEGLGIRDFGRIDIKADKSENCFFMEANLVPGMTKGSSYFPRACKIANDLGYDEVVGIIVNNCLSRIAPGVVPA